MTSLNTSFILKSLVRCSTLDFIKMKQRMVDSHHFKMKVYFECRMQVDLIWGENKVLQRTRDFKIKDALKLVIQYFLQYYIAFFDFLN